MMALLRPALGEKGSVRLKATVLRRGDALVIARTMTLRLAEGILSSEIPLAGSE
jgi:hypothetical protein